MTILVVCDVYGKESNGTIVAAKNLITAMREKGHKVKVLCSDPASKEELDTFVAPNLVLPGFIQKYVKKNGVSLSRPNKKIAVQALEGVDIVHIMQPLFLGNYMAKLAKKKGYLVTAGFHTQAENISSHFLLMNSRKINAYLYKFFWKNLYRYCDAIHYPTEFIRNLFENAIKRKTNGYVISNGVDDEFFKAPYQPRNPEFNGKYVIVFSGRLSKEKNQIMLIKAVELSKYKDKIQLIFAGGGPLLDELTIASKNLPIQPIFKLYPHNHLVNVLRNCDLYVHPALIDLESISCLEAISCGALPLLSDSPRAAVSEYSRDSHCIFHYYSPQDLANHIDWFIEHPKEAQEIKAKYKDFGKNYNLSMCMEKMEKMFEDVYKLKKSK